MAKKNYLKMEVFSQSLKGDWSNDKQTLTLTGQNKNGTACEVHLDIDLWSLQQINREMMDLLIKRYNHQLSRIDSFRNSTQKP